MSMYVPDPNLRHTGVESAEFIDAHHAAQPGDRPVARVDRREGPTVHLDTQTRLDITRWAAEYIAGLVENDQGDREDVRAVIHDLQDRSGVIATRAGLVRDPTEPAGDPQFRTVWKDV